MKKTTALFFSIAFISLFSSVFAAGVIPKDYSNRITVNKDRPAIVFPEVFFDDEGDVTSTSGRQGCFQAGRSVDSSLIKVKLASGLWQSPKTVRVGYLTDYSGRVSPGSGAVDQFVLQSEFSAQIFYIGISGPLVCFEQAADSTKMPLSGVLAGTGYGTLGSAVKGTVCYAYNYVSKDEKYDIFVHKDDTVRKISMEGEPGFSKALSFDSCSDEYCVSCPAEFPVVFAEPEFEFVKAVYNVKSLAFDEAAVSLSNPIVFATPVTVKLEKKFGTQTVSDSIEGVSKIDVYTGVDSAGKPLPLPPFNNGVMSYANTNANSKTFTARFYNLAPVQAEEKEDVALSLVWDDAKKTAVFASNDGMEYVKTDFKESSGISLKFSDSKTDLVFSISPFKDAEAWIVPIVYFEPESGLGWNVPKTKVFGLTPEGNILSLEGLPSGSYRVFVRFTGGNANTVVSLVDLHSKPLEKLTLPENCFSPTKAEYDFKVSNGFGTAEFELPASNFGKLIVKENPLSLCVPKSGLGTSSQGVNYLLAGETPLVTKAIEDAESNTLLVEDVGSQLSNPSSLFSEGVKYDLLLDDGEKAFFEIKVLDKTQNRVAVLLQLPEEEILLDRGEECSASFNNPDASQKCGEAAPFCWGELSCSVFYGFDDPKSRALCEKVKNPDYNPDSDSSLTQAEKDLIKNNREKLKTETGLVCRASAARYGSHAADAFACAGSGFGGSNFLYYEKNGKKIGFCTDSKVATLIDQTLLYDLTGGKYSILTGKEESYERLMSEGKIVIATLACTEEVGEEFEAPKTDSESGGTSRIVRVFKCSEVSAQPAAGETPAGGLPELGGETPSTALPACVSYANPASPSSSQVKCSASQPYCKGAFAGDYRCYSTPARYGESAGDAYACAGKHDDNPGDDKGTDFLATQNGGWCATGEKAKEVGCAAGTPVVFSTPQEFSRDTITRTVSVWDCTSKGQWWNEGAKTGSETVVGETSSQKPGTGAGSKTPKTPPASKCSSHTTAESCFTQAGCSWYLNANGVGGVCKIVPTPTGVKVISDFCKNKYGSSYSCVSRNTCDPSHTTGQPCELNDRTGGVCCSAQRLG